MKVCNLSSGSKGNCTYIETEKHKILIDIGTSCLYVEKALIQIGINPIDIDLVLITHAHIDHVKGLKIFNKKYSPQIYVSEKILKEANLESMEFKQLDNLENLKDISIQELKLSHDVTDINGYIIQDDINSMVYITDTGYIKEKYFKQLLNKSLYVFESNYDVEKLMNNSNYPHQTKIRILSDKGHLSNDDSAYYLSQFIGTNTRYVILSHLSEQNNTNELALNTLKKFLINKKIHSPEIIIAGQNKSTELLEL